jgi:primosomal protein N' (replication factor Y)
MTPDTTSPCERVITRVRARVLLPLPLTGAYDYVVPADRAVAPGDFVIAPLGRNHFAGVVWDAPADDAPAEPTVPETKLRALDERLDVPPMPASMRRFVDWVANYTLSPPGAVLRMAMSVSAALSPPAPLVAYRLAELGAAALSARQLTPGRRRVLATLGHGQALVPRDLAAEAGVSPAVLRGLLELGAIEAVELPEAGPDAQPDWRHPGPVLSADQRRAADALIAEVERARFAVTLLEGVTGSGKTEVYFEALAAALAAGRQVLVLLPEIALSVQWLDRFARRFGVRPALWHSDLTSAQRRATWRQIARGEVSVVVGARSALFLPLARLGLIVVDEEHDGSYKQEDGVIYHARDMAVVRARLAGAPIVLVSATPSLESQVNAAQGRYGRLHLPDRHAGALMPQIAIVDLRRQPPPRGRWLTPPLVDAIEATLARGEQIMLFLNRRGYAPLTLCRACGHRLHCPNCSTWLVEHRLMGRLICHHCGHGERLPAECPHCATPGAFVPCGPGVERLSDEVGALFPAARRAIMASDMMIGPLAAEALVGSMAAREIDILIGTQMMAKGHHFPHLTLVGVVDADLGLAGGDLRAGERTYQLLHQVAGRAGRAEHPGRVLLQTAAPEQPVIQALLAGDDRRFFETEAAERRAHAMPPFGRLAALIVSAHDAELADRIARLLARAAPHAQGVAVLGPAPAPLSLLRGRYRRRLLLKAPREVAVQPLLRAWLAQVKLPGAVRVQVDVDPYSFL